MGRAPNDDADLPHPLPATSRDQAPVFITDDHGNKLTLVPRFPHPPQHASEPHQAHIDNKAAMSRGHGTPRLPRHPCLLLNTVSQPRPGTKDWMVSRGFRYHQPALYEGLVVPTPSDDMAVVNQVLAEAGYEEVLSDDSEAIYTTYLDEAEDLRRGAEEMNGEGEWQEAGGHGEDDEGWPAAYADA